MSIKFYFEESNYNLKERTRLKNWISDTVHSESKKAGKITYIFTSDNYLLKINQQYLSHNYFTDIITFNYCENDIINGDIFISIDTVKNNSTRFDVTMVDELHRVMIHGILHLVGFNDQTNDEKAIMREKENYYLDRLKNLF